MIGHGVVGNLPSAITNHPTGWQRTSTINSYIQFIYQGLHKRIWDKLKHKIYLGDDDFVKKHQALQSMLDGDLSEVPLKQRRPIAKRLSEYQQ
ncbi:hypothetical protein [Aeromonas caviae]|uniref:hypothetical protein n=1 Tax=Aeromonas caviae TaxID=648 RepID=UPI0038CFC883